MSIILCDSELSSGQAGDQQTVTFRISSSEIVNVLHCALIKVYIQALLHTALLLSLQ